jgi:hypothetical protein
LLRLVWTLSLGGTGPRVSLWLAWHGRICPEVLVVRRCRTCRAHRNSSVEKYTPNPARRRVESERTFVQCRQFHSVRTAGILRTNSIWWRCSPGEFAQGQEGTAMRHDRAHETQTSAPREQCSAVFFVCARIDLPDHRPVTIATGLFSSTQGAQVQ